MTSLSHLEPRVSRDGLALLLLMVLLTVSTSPFFGRFALFALIGGLATCLALGQWNGRHPARAGRTAMPDGQPPMINVAAIRVGGDVAGLVFAGGAIVIFVMSLEVLRWFVVSSAVLSFLFAVAVIRWRRSHSVWSTHSGSLGRP